MIKINDVYSIEIDSCNYILVRHTKKSKTIIGYFTRLTGALSRAAEELSRDELKTSVWGVSDAVEVINKNYRLMMDKLNEEAYG